MVPICYLLCGSTGLIELETVNMYGNMNKLDQSYHQILKYVFRNESSPLTSLLLSKTMVIYVFVCSTVKSSLLKM